MPISTATGVYTAVSGAETATAGATIASATWNSINTDYQNTFTTIGTTLFARNDVVRFTVRTVSISTSLTDLAVSIPVSTLPGTPSTYAVINVMMANATATCSGAAVAVYTGAGATGVTVATSAAVTITTSLPNNNNSMQALTINNPNTEIYNVGTLFFRTVSAAAAQVDLFVEVRPM